MNVAIGPVMTRHFSGGSILVERKKKKIKWGNWLSLLGRALDGDPATDVLATPGPSKRLAQFHGNAQSIQLGLAQCGADFKEAAKVKVAFKGIFFFLLEITFSISSRKNLFKCCGNKFDGVL